MAIVPAPARRVLCLLLANSLAIAFSFAETQARTGLEPRLAASIDEAAMKILASTGVPSASVAVVRDGAISYLKAYGTARLTPSTPATPAMRYAIGSISKQFTAAALATLAAEGRLGLDDEIAKFFPDLTRAGEISVRQLLSHTAGIRDYWPQDYVPAEMLSPITRNELLNRWARQPLDFEPGTKYQYSNTGYVIAGAIVEKVSGKPLMAFLNERIFNPLGMTSVTDIDRGPLPAEDATGYLRYALGPLRPAPKEGRGWLFAAGQLAMTAEDLARWDLSLIDGPIPDRAVYREITREVVLRNGAGIRYGLGLSITLDGDRHVVAHDGEVSGFTAVNRVFPEDRAAIVVLVNQDAADAASSIAGRIAEALFQSASPGDGGTRDQVARIFADLQKGRFDRSLFTANANGYFNEAALADCKEGLRKLGSPESVTPTWWGLRGGLMTRAYRAVFKKTTLRIVTRTTPEGKLEQYTVGVE